MLINIPNITKINLLLGVAIVVLSLLSIIWHHQSYQLYKQSRVIESQSQQIVALHKQLLSEYSEQINGFQINTKALNILKMQPVLPNTSKVIVL